MRAFARTTGGIVAYTLIKREKSTVIVHRLIEETSTVHLKPVSPGLWERPPAPPVVQRVERTGRTVQMSAQVAPVHDDLDEWRASEDLRERYSRMVDDYRGDEHQIEIHPASLPGGGAATFVALVEHHLTLRPETPMRERVRHGAAYMTQFYPGWVLRSAPERLDMGRPSRHILNQGGRKPIVLGVEPGCLYEDYMAEADEQDAIRNGFIPGPEETWEELTAAWAELLAEWQADETRRRW